MKISVVIPTFNRRQLLEQCLASLVTQTFPSNEYELIVVADGCTDDTVEFLRSFTAPCAFRWITQPNQGAPAAQNTGVAAASGDILLFLDDDCVCDERLLAVHAEKHERSERIVVIGATLVHPQSPPGTLSDFQRTTADARFKRQCAEGLGRSDLMLCANSSIAREAMRDCWFDPKYKRIHDVEHGQRLWEKGYRPQFAPPAVAYEVFVKTADGVVRDSYYQGKYEVELSISSPAFRPLAGIVMMNEGNALKRELRKRMALHPRASEMLLRSIGRVAESLRSLSAFSWLAERCLSGRFVISYLSGAIQAAGSWKALEERFGKRIPVIMYHNVGTPRANEYPGLSTPIEAFEAQMSYLSRLGYSGIRPSDWLAWRDRGTKLPERPVMLVFDDAYSELCRNAFPILERIGFGAACMVVTGCIGSTNRWDEEAGLPSLQLMCESEILEWSERGIEFGGHTRHHPDLRLIPAEEVEREIVQCKSDLTELLNKVPTSFAYPFGGFSPTAQTAARDHFDLAFTTHPGRLHLATNSSLVPRISFLPGETRFGMWCRLKLGINLSQAFKGLWAKLLQMIRNSSVSGRTT